MSQAILFAFLGLGLGAMYALVSLGLIVIYRSSGVLNFAQGAIAMAGAYAFYELRVRQGQSFLVSCIGGIALATLIGVLVYVLIMRRLERAAPVIRIAATLGVLLTLQALAVLIYGPAPVNLSTDLPTTPVSLLGTHVPAFQLVLVAIALVLSLVLWALYHHTPFGRSTAAVAEHVRNSAALGLSPGRIAAVNWALGSALAGLAGILIAPILTLVPGVFTTLLLSALAIGLVAGFRSFAIAILAGCLLGVAQSEVNYYSSITGAADTVPFAVIVVWLIVRGKALPLRDHIMQRLPAIGTGRVRVWLVVAGALAGIIPLAVLPVAWQDALIVLYGTALVLLSIVVLTGYAGQISLAQFALAGFGAWVAGRLDAAAGLPFIPALLTGVAASVVLGVLFAVPALRVRGINLAIVTLGLASALEVMLFDNGSLTGGFVGTVVHSPSLFGWSIDPISHPQRYGYTVLAAFVIAALVVANLRRGRTGRRLLAVRTNERAAAALGINVFSVKTYAFAVSAGIAGLGGVFLAFQNQYVLYSTFTSLLSVQGFGYATLGGVGFVLGPFFGGTLVPGSIGVPLGNTILANISNYLPLIGGVSIIVVALQNPDGIAPKMLGDLRSLGRRLLRGRSPRSGTGGSVVARAKDSAAVQRVRPSVLAVEELVVKYGAVVAVDRVNFTIKPARVIGLIGPNGAGKTSVIDAISGFTPIAGGTVTLDGVDVSDWSAVKRARGGVIRSFQSLELFEDVTVLDNLRTASDGHDRWSYLRDLIWPASPPLCPEAMAAITEFDLTDNLFKCVEDLSYGERRLLAMARAVACAPSILLLDEPAAGLGDRETAELGVLVRRLADEWGIGILVVEHDMSFVKSVCDDLVVLDFGRQIAAGPNAAVRSDPAVIAAYLGETAEERERERAIDEGDAVTPPATVHVVAERANGSGPKAVDLGMVLQADRISCGYGIRPVLHDVSIEVGRGEVVALLGANGTGKTTTLLALSGELPLHAGAILADGRVTKAALNTRARDGLAVIPEERSVFRGLSTLDNLRLGDADPELALELFPELEKRLSLAAGMLSGGEQQMLALGRALSRRPTVLLADELSLGLAPLAVQRLLEAVRKAADEHGTAVIIVEQHVRKALQYSDRGYVMSQGRIQVEGTAEDLRSRMDEIQDTYMAAASPAGAVSNG
jgi:ABC-type branched-subunit amino acid transport system ATPase component/ABC-type branched-subunit amino acid transport system permease subunit